MRPAGDRAPRHMMPVLAIGRARSWGEAVGNGIVPAAKDCKSASGSQPDAEPKLEILLSAAGRYGVIPADHVPHTD